MRSNDSRNLELKIRLPAVAGAFYPATIRRLEEQVNALLSGAPDPPETNRLLRGLILPISGYVYSGSVAAAGIKRLQHQFREKEIELLLLGPSHCLWFEGASLSSDDAWQTPIGLVPISKRSKEFFSDIVLDIPKVHQEEHCLEVELPFLQIALSDFSIIPIVTGEIDPQKLAEEIQPLLSNRTVVIASSDLSHYLSYDEAIEKDKSTIESIVEKDIPQMEKTGDACGKNPILILMRIAQQKGWTPELLEYKNSGDTAGEKKRVVGYAAIAYWEEPK